MTVNIVFVQLLTTEKQSGPAVKGVYFKVQQSTGMPFFIDVLLHYIAYCLYLMRKLLEFTVTYLNNFVITSPYVQPSCTIRTGDLHWISHKKATCKSCKNDGNYWLWDKTIANVTAIYLENKWDKLVKDPWSVCHPHHDETEPPFSSCVLSGVVMWGKLISFVTTRTLESLFRYYKGEKELGFDSCVICLCISGSIVCQCYCSW
jgi:hypothetical protein